MTEETHDNGGYEPDGVEALELPRLPSIPAESASAKNDRRRKELDRDHRRLSIREPVDVIAIVRDAFGNEVEGRIRDLSPQGCGIELLRETQGIGETIWLKVAGFNPWKGTVRWVNGRRAGIEFERALHSSIFQLVTQSNQPAAWAKASPTPRLQFAEEDALRCSGRVSSFVK